MRSMALSARARRRPPPTSTPTGIERRRALRLIPNAPGAIDKVDAAVDERLIILRVTLARVD
jgi:hypothetical protein